MDKPIVHSSKVVHANPWYEVRQDSLTLPNGKYCIFFVAVFRGASCVICVEDGKILTVKQYRYTTDSITVEFPMGGIKPEHHDPLQAAKEELQEETGYSADRWERIGTCHSLNGACKMQLNVFVAEGLHAGPTQLDESETGMGLEWIPIDEWRRMIREGAIDDGETLAAWALYREWKGF